MKKKIIACITGLVMVAMIVPSSAQAVTAAELQAQIDALMATLAELQAQLSELTGDGGVGVSCTFTRSLYPGMTGTDVKCLQEYLNDAGYTVAPSGYGSAGNETEYYGSLTKAAVGAWQDGNGVAYGNYKGYFGPISQAKYDALAAAGEQEEEEEEEEEEAGELDVTLASDSPVSGTIVGGTAPQGLATLAKFTFTNNGDGSVKVTQLKLNRIGISADAGISNVYLFDGAVRLTDSASVASGVITFTETTGIFTVPAGGSKTVAVKVDLSTTSTAGETYGIAINAVADVVSNATDVSGAFPIKGNLMTVATATLAGVNFGAAAAMTPTANLSLAPQDDFTVWQSTVSFTTRAVDFTRISFRMIGSIKYADIQNFRLYVSGVQVGSAIASLDDAGYVTFDLSADPERIEAGSRIIKLVADIIGGSDRTFKFSIRSAADANFIDTQYNVNVFPKTAGSETTFTVSDVTAGLQTVSAGTLTVTKMSDSPSGDIVNTAPAVTLAKFELKAAGEKVKIETLTVRWIFTDGGLSNITATLRNTMLLANDVQIGSTKSMVSTTDGSEFPLGSSLVVEPGSPVILKVVGDVYDNHLTNTVSSADTIQIRIVADTGNALGMVSSTSIAVPASNTDGNSLTVREGALTLAKYTAYTDQTTVAPLNDYKLAHFTLTANTTEAVNLNTITVTLDDVSSYATDLYVKYGTGETSHVASVSAPANSYSVNYQLAAGTTIDVEVYLDVSSSMTSNDGVASVLIAGSTADSATSVYTGATATGTTLAGQTISFSSATFSTAADAATPIAAIVAGNQTVTAAKFKFTSLYDTSTIKEVKVKLDNASAATISGAIKNVILKDGSTVLGTKPLNESSTVPTDSGSTVLNSATTFTGLSVEVPANTSKVLTVDLELAVPVADTGTSQVDVAMTLDSVKYASSQGVETTSSTDRSGKELRVYKSIPVFTAKELSSGQSVNLAASATTEIYRFNVAADSKGPIYLKQLKFSVVVTDAGTDVALSADTFKFFKGSTDITSSLVTIQNPGGESLAGTDSHISEGTTTVVVTFVTEESIAAGASQEYVLKFKPTNFAASATGNDSVSTNIPTDTTHHDDNVYAYDSTTGSIFQLADDNSAGDATAFNVIWSDDSALSHDATTAESSADWASGYKVLNLPLDSKGVVCP